jgi:replication factor C small subunit
VTVDIWTDKYRPDSLEEITGQQDIVSRLSAFVDEGSIPHLMFTGPAGTGKTTSAMAVAKDLYGDEWRQNFKETNASDDRGIDVVREEIKDFARTKPVDADYKIIFLDEADALTTDAQQALRRTMEQYSDNARFILSCNYSSKIIDPIQSRCALFRYNRLEESEVREYVSKVSSHEDFTVSDEALDAILRVASGDLRRTTNILQTVALRKDEVDEEDIYTAAASLRPDEINEILEKALNQEFMDARNQLSDLMIDRGLDGKDVIDAIHREVLDLDITDDKKMKMIENLGEYQFRIVQGGSNDIQIEALLASIGDL